MSFRELQMRLLSHIRTLVHNGVLTERSLARLTGISQPHIHNVLKGKRLASTAMADQILLRLRVDLLDLLAPEEARSAEKAEFCTVALLEGFLGPGYPYPGGVSISGYPFPAAEVEKLESPMAVRLKADPERPPHFNHPGVVLLECDIQRLDLDEEAYVALDLGGSGTIGLLRGTPRHIYLWDRESLTWHPVALPAGSPSESIKGRVSYVVQRMMR